MSSPDSTSFGGGAGLGRRSGYSRDSKRKGDPPEHSLLDPVPHFSFLLWSVGSDAHRTSPRKYKFARVFRIPQEPTIHQRFGIALHQVLERFHSDGGGDLTTTSEWSATRIEESATCALEHVGWLN